MHRHARADRVSDDFVPSIEEFERRAALASAAFDRDFGRETFSVNALDMLRIAAFAGFDVRAIAVECLKRSRGKVRASMVEEIMGRVRRAWPEEAA